VVDLGEKPVASIILPLLTALSIFAVTTMSHKKVHQGTEQEQQIGPVSCNMIPVFPEEVKHPDYDHHADGDTNRLPEKRWVLLSVVMRVLPLRLHNVPFSILKIR